MKQEELTMDTKPYTFWRIKRILKRDYHCELENINQGYKATRKLGYRELYRIINLDTMEIICPQTSLNALRKLLTQEGYPVHDADDRNIEAENFLELVKGKEIN